MLTEEKIRALFELTNLSITNLTSQENPYWQDTFTAGPQWIVEGPYGKLRLHWRKRVLEINWSETILRFPQADQFGRDDIQTDKVFTYDDVTQSDVMVHAYSYGKAVDYLWRFKMAMGRAVYVADYLKRKAAGELTEEEAITDLHQRTHYGDLKNA